MRIGVIGTGHVGLVTCVTLASLGNEVVGTDSDHDKLALLQAGKAPFFEPGLQDLLEEGLGSSRLSFTRDPSEVVAGADVVFICVGTPPRADGEANLVAVEKAARTVARHATGPLVIGEKSTVPTGTAHRLSGVLHRERSDVPRIDVVSCPEFLREGKAIHDSLHPERILIGADNETSFETMRRVFAPLIERGCPLVETDIETAELSKHASNAFLALKVSFVNALARVCEKTGADVVSVSEVMGLDSRIGPAFLDAGLGWGGSCFPKDLVAFERVAKRAGYEFPLLSEIARINDEVIDAAVETIKEALWNLEEKRIVLLGLAFKPGTDDVRFSPALNLARRLVGEGATVIGYDPEAADRARAEIPELELARDPYSAASGAHCVVMCTQWEEFADLDLDKLREVMVDPVMVDGRNLFDPERMRAAGFAYYAMGRSHPIR